MQIGHFSRKQYDSCYLPDRNQQSTQPANYLLNTNRIYNCNRCLSTLGPRSTYNGHGVSTTGQTRYAESQDLVDTESLLSDRGSDQSRCKKGGVNNNFKNASQMKMYDTKECNCVLNPNSTRLSHPSSNYRDVEMNRFHNLQHDPQENIFEPFAKNTHLETIDNFKPTVPKLWGENMTPKTILGKGKNCQYGCNK